MEMLRQEMPIYRRASKEIHPLICNFRRSVKYSYVALHFLLRQAKCLLTGSGGNFEAAWHLLRSEICICRW
jgi:hypothetical protein